MRSHRITLIPLLCGAAAFGLYLATLAPTVGAGDSAELALAAGRGGIPHPPGYPLWVLAAWLFVRVPGLALLGDLAWRTNLLSAVLTAAAVGGTALLGLRLRRSPAAAALAAGFVALAPTIWATATVAEVHALNLLLLVSWGHAALSAVRRPTPGGSVGLGLAGTLFLTYHPANVLLVPLLGAATVGILRRPGASVAGGLAGLGLGLLPLAWLPLRAVTAPEFDTFGAARPDRLLAGWSREFYGPLRQAREVTAARLGGQLSATLESAWATYGAAGLLFAGLGAWRWLSRRPGAGLLAATSALLVLLGPWLVLNAEPDAAHRLSIEPTQAPVWLGLALLAAMGFDRLRALLRASAKATGGARRLEVAAAGALVALLAVQGVPQLERQDRSTDRIARWYGEDLLRGVAPNATLFVEGDNELFLTAYLQAAEGLRPDVRLVHRRGYLVADPLGWRGVPRAAVTAARDAREADFVRCSDAPVYFASRPEWIGGGEFALRREGLAWRVTTAARAATDRAPAPDPWPELHAEAWQVAPESLDFLHRKCLSAYYAARAEWLSARGDAGGARRLWEAVARVGFDFPETPGLLAQLAETGSGAAQ